MRSENWIKIIALIELVAAMPWPGVYLYGWYLARKSESLDAWMVALTIEGALFLIAPMLATVGAFLRKKWAAYLLMVFPVLAFIHGISAIPYLSHIAPIGPWRTLALVAINGGLIILIFRHRKGLVPSKA